MRNITIKENLQTLINSCAEGYTGEWDSSGEGREGFLAMAEVIQRIAQELKIVIEEPNYEGEDEEDT